MYLTGLSNMFVFTSILNPLKQPEIKSAVLFKANTHALCLILDSVNKPNRELVLTLQDQTCCEFSDTVLSCLVANSFDPEEML